MPQVPNVSGQPTKARVMIQPPVEEDSKAQVAPVQAIPTHQQAIPTQQKEPEPQPEPAINVADYKGPTQDELAALSITTQTVANKRVMTPNDPAYKFTDNDRKIASEARWANKYPWEEVSIEDGLSQLALLRAETERGGLIMQRRVSELKVEKVKCFGCDNMINISEGRWATYRTRNNFETGLPESAYACSGACGLKLNRDFSHPVRVPIPIER